MKKGCSSGHFYADDGEHCRRRGKLLGYADGIHVYDPRSNKPIEHFLSKEQRKMRINVYSQELTDEVQVEEKVSNTGLIYTAVRFILHSSHLLHHPPKDDDRSGITFWLPKSRMRREELAKTFELMAKRVREAKAETGLD